MKIIGSIIKEGLRLSNTITENKISPIERQQRVLNKLLVNAQNTRFGEKFNFKEVLNSNSITDSFKDQVPVFDYEKIHKDWWHRLEEEEEDVCWPGKIKYFALSSGTTTGSSKHIPVSDEMIKNTRKCGIQLLLSLEKYDLPSDFFQKQFLLMGSSTELEKREGKDIFFGDISGIGTGKIPSWLNVFSKPGRNIGKIKDWQERIKAIAENAKDWDIGAIAGIPAWNQLMLEKVVEHYGADNIHEIWPGLELYVTGGTAFEPYRKSFEKLLGHPLVYIDTYFASEGFFAFQNRPDTNHMKLALNHGIYFEFVPFDDMNFPNGELSDKAEFLNISEVEEGRDYALIISTCAGIWRYLLGDTIKFTDIEKSEIAITGRTKHFLNLCAEHLSVDNMNQAIRMLENELDIEVEEFTVGAVPQDEKNYYAHKWYLGTENGLEDNEVREKLDSYLQQLNKDYADQRKATLDMKLELIHPDQFIEYQQKKGRLGGQNKFPKVLKGEQLEEWDDFVNGNS